MQSQPGQGPCRAPEDFSEDLSIKARRQLARILVNVCGVLFRLDRFQEELGLIDEAEKLFLEINDRRGLAWTHTARAIALTSLNDRAGAYRHYDLAMQLAHETGQTDVAVRCAYNLGYLHRFDGQYTKALRSLTETRSSTAPEKWHPALCDLAQSEVYLELNMYKDAARLAASACARLEEAGEPYEVARALTVMGIAASHLRRHGKALNHFARARGMFEAQGNRVRAAAVDIHRAVICIQRGRYDEARRLARSSYADFMRQDAKPKAALSRVISARAGLELCDLDQAYRDAAEAASIHEQSPMPWVAHQLHSILGEIYLMQDDLERAREEFRTAIDGLERVRGDIAGDELRVNYLKDKVGVYELLARTNLRLGSPARLEEAFETVERAKSRTLADLLAGNIEPSGRVAPIPVEVIQQNLPPEAVLVEYFMTGDDVVAFCLGRRGFEVMPRICSRNALKKRFELLRFQLLRAGVEAAADALLQNIQDHLTALYRMLVAPIEAFLGGRQSLVFVPFDFLHDLPFHALFDGNAYLMDRFRISYSPAANIHRLFSARRAESNGNAVVVGVPDARTPFIIDEIESICSALPRAAAIVGPAATAERVVQEVGRAGLVHIASHASFRPDNPMFSSIRLHDRPLNFFDIYNLRTSASLVTLSGCGTGLSGVVAGDELLGLVRGFLYAGARSIVVSLWDVNDRTTADLMKYFYNHLALGTPKSESLRLAMLRLREQRPHPYHWAPFLLVGDPN